MHITLPRRIATQLWHHALEQPGTISGLLEKNQDNYEIRPLSLYSDWHAGWDTQGIQIGGHFPFAYYQSFCDSHANPVQSDWGNLPSHCLLMALMLDVKGLLVLNAFYLHENKVESVNVTLAPESMQPTS